MKLPLSKAAEMWRSGEPLPDVDPVIDFDLERRNRPPRFVEIIEDYAGGLPVFDIEAKYKCSRNTVLRYARLAGLAKRPKCFDPRRRAGILAAYELGKPVAEIAAFYGVSEAYVSNAAQEAGIGRYKGVRP